MRAELESEDIQAIAAAVVSLLTPLLANQKTGEAEDRIMGVTELAEYLGMSDKWIYDQTSNKSIPYFKLGSNLKFKQKAIDKWMKKFEMPVVSKPSAVLKLVSRQQPAKGCTPYVTT